MQITHWKEKLSVTNVTYDRNKGSVLNLYNINKQDDSEIRIIRKIMNSTEVSRVAQQICRQSRRCRRLEFDLWVGKIPWRRK